MKDEMESPEPMPSSDSEEGTDWTDWTEPVPEGNGGELASYLPFYDRLRGRIHRSIVGRRGSRLRVEAAELLLLAPDLFILMVRLILDSETPTGARGVLGGALAYFLLPTDLLPEALLGVGGFSEDLVMAAVAISCALSEELEPRAEEYWSGPQDLRRTLRDLVLTGQALLGDRLYGRLQRFLARRGLPLNESPSPPR